MAQISISAAPMPIKKYSFTHLHSRYYKSNDAVVQDPEIQNFINELSVDGTRPPFNGQGHVSNYC